MFKEFNRLILSLTSMETQVILNTKQFNLTLQRLCRQLIENHDDFSNTVLIGLQPRGIPVLNRLKSLIENILGKEIQCGTLDITFHRDDFRRRNLPPIPNITNIDFSLENKDIVLVDDVLYTGRSIRAGLDAMLTYGRPNRVELLIFIDRRFQRHLPIQADYIGKTVDSLVSERVSVEWDEFDGEDQVILYTPKSNE